MELCVDQLHLLMQKPKVWVEVGLFFQEASWGLFEKELCQTRSRDSLRHRNMLVVEVGRRG